ncbi:Polycystic kidney disease 1 like 1 [Takifugu flavidus]|uniref:Polycystic kidney disease 1 like 1 n=1 Tax=Takifugu flavidus TaxID=433684 RepID=A0A5C6NZ88_9TELE|nr:Polycystic kidney disease 1 like 1 [Takifugu flavidus]
MVDTYQHEPNWQRYDVVLVVLRGGTQIATDVFPLVIQRPVRLNRLQHQVSVLLNHTVTMNCWVSAGTDLSFLWSFGDGFSRPGHSTEKHIFQMTGEFRVTVTVFNLVSSVSLSSHIFVVTQPCQPPPVKNMGPSKLQVRRYEVIRVGVTYEREFDCGSGGLHYSWILLDSAGWVFPLPAIDTHRQTLTLPGYLLDYDIYTAVAKALDSCVRVQVIPSSPVASIQGGTNIFVSRNTVVSLDGQKSYDPDFPLNPVSFQWTCEPISSISSSCFHTDIPISSPVLKFPAGVLKQPFDQFRFVLTVFSSERSSSSEIFITLTPNVIRKASVLCSQCQGDRVNWDQSFTFSALCDGCDVAPEHIQLTWSLYLVNASSKPLLEDPLCHTVDLSTLSAEASQYSAASSDSAVVSGFEKVFKTRVKSLKMPNDSLLSKNERKKSSLPPRSGTSGILDSDQYEHSNISGFPVDPGSSADWDFSFPVSESGQLDGQPGSHDSVLGRTQLFFQTNPVPDGMMCQVQPAKGLELFTHFSIFCASGKEDLTYKYSIRVADPAPRTLYQGTDYQYYFSLPSGDPLDDYKVTIYTEIRSSTYGTVTTPCPVSVQVLPHFSREASSSHFDPDLELSESGLRNLSALLPLGNSAEIRNYISLLTAILNRLSLEDGSNTRAQRRARNVLICTTCQLESGEQVTLVSARRVTGHIQAISRRFSKFGTSVQFSLDQQTLNTLVALLSHSLQATVRGNRTRISRRVDANGELEADLQEENIRKGRSIINSCELEEPLSAQHVVQLVTDVLEVTADLMLKYILLHEVQEHRVNSRLIVLHGRRQNQTAPVISGNLAALYLPDSLLLRLHVHHRGETESRPSQPCVLAILIEFSLSPFTWARHHERLNGPVVDLNLYQCSTRRKIPDFSLIEPVTVELQEQPREKNTSEHQHILQHRQVDYHSFNITQEHLQHAIQLRVHFRPPPNKVFPIMLLFRMFERPTPSMHHLSRTHRWEGNTVILTLPTSVLSTAGVGYLALLNADFAKSARRKDVSKQVRYSFRVDSSVCLSWDAQQGFWTHSSCRTMQTDATASVNCSCNQLRPTTVVQQEIHSSYDTSDVNLFFSMPSNLTVLCVLLLCVCPYVPGWVACKRADAISEENQRVHHLSDNCPHDQYLYAVTIHTGPCSAACMSAKVYIVLYGEDAVSQTKELQVPECTLFKRNSQDTFILSAADSLGPVWGVHIWHDNSGSSPSWYLKQVEVCEVSPGPVNKWLFVAQCWLAVDKDDGQVERTLRVCEQGITFAELLRLKLHDYLADYHIWMSVLSCPHPNPFTHTQRLCVSLLLLLGYAAVNIAVILKMEDQFDVAMIDVSALSVKTGVVERQSGPPVDTLAVLLSDILHLPHPASRGNLKPAKQSDALSILKALHSSGWLNRCSTVKLRFTLFSPASNRFTSVTMLAEQRLTGVMQPSAEVHTARVYHTPALWDYVVMVLQLLYILFSLLQLCDQVHTLGQQGIMGYWKAPCNWMEVGLLTVTLVYHIFCIYGSVLILEFRKLLQRQEGHVDVSLLATCEQHIRSLRGVMLFFLMLKSLIVLRVFRTMATSAKLLASSLAKLFWPMISGIILMVALSCMGNLLFGQGSNNFSTVVGSLQSLLCHHRGLRAVNDLHSSWGAFLFPGFYLSSTLVWMAAVLAVVSSAVTSARRCHHREDEFTVVQLAGYIMRRPKNLHVDNVEEKTYYFEEFESLLDELLFRLSALSNSLHHTLPPKAYHCREDSPVSSNISDHLDAQFFRMKKTEGSIEEILPASPLLL